MPLSAPVVLPSASEILPQRSTIALNDVDEARATISELFCEHRLSPIERTQVRLRLRSAHVGGVGLDMVDYGEAVQISPVGLGDFHLVQIPLAGRATMVAGNARIDSTPGTASLPPLDQPFTMRWDRATPHLNVFVDRSTLVETAARVYGLSAPHQLRIALKMNLDAPAGRAFLRAVFELHDAVENGFDGGYASKLATELLVARLLQAVDNSVSRSLDTWPGSTPADQGRGDALSRRFLDRVDDAVERGSGLLEIVGDLDVPLRTLQDHVRSATGRTPSVILRDARFRRARQLLRDADPARETVTAIAQRCGFGHVGRFAIDYRQRYGESPATTLRS